MRKALPILKNYFIREIGDWKFWISVAAFFKVSLFLFQLTQVHSYDIQGFVGHVGGDTESYLEPVANLIESGEYSPDYRMPGYAVIYYPLLLLFSKSTACNVMIVLQVMLASVSVYCLALASRNLFKSDNLFYFVFYAFSISSYANLFDSYLLSESFCTSATILSVYFLSLYFNGSDSRVLIPAGLFLTWAFFLRPVYAPFIAFSCLILIYYSVAAKKTRKEIAVSLLFFLSMFLVIETSWVARNYIVKKRIVVLTATLYGTEFEDSYKLELMNFVKSWGGDRTWWNPNAEIRWFGVIESQQNRSQPLVGPVIQIPEYIFTSRFTMDSLETIKSYIQTIDNPQTSVAEAKAYTIKTKNSLRAYTESIKEEKPFLYYVKSSAILMKKFFVHSGTYNLFNKPSEQLSPPEFILKVFYSLFYIATLCFALAGTILMMTIKKRSPTSFIILGVALYSVLIFPCFLGQIEFRYFVPGYPFILVVACYFLCYVTEIIWTRATELKPIE